MALSIQSDGTIVVDRVWKRFRRDRSRPFLSDRVRTLTRRAIEREANWRWVLRDIDFTVQPGEAVAMIGANGAGKSTLLKLLTRVMYPYAGSIEIRGRVGSILELRGGMHPDLSGRENMFMYGALLGLTRSEVRQSFDTIVNFAELAPAIDRSLKYYSSGMQMRLGFAIAAFMRPSILLVDEVLAVGDAWFQQRCLDRMREVLNEGTTLMLVSHDLASIEATCRRGLWLRDGTLVADGPVREVLGAYRQSIELSTADAYEPPDAALRLVDFALESDDGGLAVSHGTVRLTMTFDAAALIRGRLHVGMSEGSATPTVLVSTAVDIGPGRVRVQCTIASLPLPRGRYSVWLHVDDPRDEDIIPWHPVGSFTLAGTDLDPSPKAVVRLAPVHVRSEWRFRNAPRPQ